MPSLRDLRNNSEKTLVYFINVSHAQFSGSIIYPEYKENGNYETKPNLKPSNKNEKTESATRRKVTVTSVTDGDSIRYFDPLLNKEVTGRFLGINAPEATKTFEKFGPEGTAFLTTLIMGKEIEIESDPNADITDKYGRYLIHAFISGKSIQQILILEGLVRVAYLYGEYNYSDLYFAAEKKAKESGHNIWSIPGYVYKKMVLTWML
ncbi:MAG: thermonuclease family protein [Bacillota bacterium]|uniref:thermonuclease family protein n=1 Tax=Cytobacillus oceanisediminis TaxID=665099 RepID=UPI0002DB2BFD|nr:thermonuclease family protein [Cytobacillus oceanisediminis]USK47254.1 thermonuclease family protein [Cytobacillus oceanisediminis]